MTAVYTNEKLKSILEEALKRFYDSEAQEFLSKKGVERSCVFRIGMYIQDLMWHDIDKYYNDLNLDCEYNKDFGQPKRNDKNEIVSPDLIIHKRNTDINLMVIEFKGYWNTNTDGDLVKLKEFTKPDGKYRYKLGALVVLNKNNTEITYFENGAETIKEVGTLESKQVETLVFEKMRGN
ncbi:MAG: hypothetical protein NC200_07470 [Candidatus Gastranaerophilales bacterium]|nr:hypothetical protein [Candidatus Gastranaerophilales bacterium]